MDRERYIANVSLVDEYIRPAVSRLAIHFVKPASIGGSGGMLGHLANGVVVAGEVSEADTGVPLGRLVHLMRRAGKGSLMRSRFYLPAGVPRQVAAALLDHCATEMARLATFPPELWSAMTAGSQR